MSTVSERVALDGHDRYLFREGTHARLYERLGAHVVAGAGGPQVRFAVWAPNARSVSVVGDFNGWDPRATSMHGSDAGVWEASVRGVALYSPSAATKIIPWRSGSNLDVNFVRASYAAPSNRAPSSHHQVRRRELRREALDSCSLRCARSRKVKFTLVSVSSSSYFASSPL